MFLWFFNVFLQTAYFNILHINYTNCSFNNLIICGKILKLSVPLARIQRWSRITVRQLCGIFVFITSKIAHDLLGLCKINCFMVLQYLWEGKYWFDGTLIFNHQMDIYAEVVTTNTPTKRSLASEKNNDQIDLITLLTFERLMS